jgi:hypothetical protein
VFSDIDFYWTNYLTILRTRGCQNETSFKSLYWIRLKYFGWITVPCF